MGGMARIENTQIARVVEVTQLHYHIVTTNGKSHWIPKAHSAISAKVDESVRIILKTRGYVRRWWIESTD